MSINLYNYEPDPWDGQSPTKGHFVHLIYNHVPVGSTKEVYGIVEDTYRDEAQRIDEVDEEKKALFQQVFSEYGDVLILKNDNDPYPIVPFTKESRENFWVVKHSYTPKNRATSRFFSNNEGLWCVYGKGDDPSQYRYVYISNINIMDKTCKIVELPIAAGYEAPRPLHYYHSLINAVGVDFSLDYLHNTESDDHGFIWELLAPVSEIPFLCNIHNRYFRGALDVV